MEKASNSGLDAYAIFCDNLLKVGPKMMRMLFNQTVIFYETAQTNDSFLFSNPSLQEMLMAPDGGELLENGIIVPRRRDTFSSFADLGKDLVRKESEKKGSFSNYCATPEFIALLDAKSKPRPFR